MNKIKRRKAVKSILSHKMKEQKQVAQRRELRQWKSGKSEQYRDRRNIADKTEVNYKERGRK